MTEPKPASAPPARRPPGRRAEYRYFQPVMTRWKDNDMMGHVNNVEYLSFFDSVVTMFEIRHVGIDLSGGTTRVVMAETSCRFHNSVSFPDLLHVGLRVAHLGKSSFSYDLALFREDEDIAAAEGRFLRVMVEMPAQRPIPIPPAMRDVLNRYT